MGWGPQWPLTAGSDIQSHDTIIKIWKALAEKSKPFGNATWPPEDFWTWDSGHISTVAQGTGSDIIVTMPTTPAWGVGNTCCPAGTQRWVNYNCTNCPCPQCYVPTSYDLIIRTNDDDLNDPLKCVRGHITAQQIDGTTGTLTISGQSILDMITAGFIDDLNELQGAFYVIKGAGHKVSADRFPAPPNEQELWIGSGGIVTVEPFQGTGTNYTAIQDSDPKTAWPVDKFAGNELLVFYGAGLRRIPIVHNDNQKLFISTTENITDSIGSYLIVAAGAKAMPGRAKWYPFQWYTGVTNVSMGHTPDDGLATTTQPENSIVIRAGNPCDIGGECKDYYDPVFDNDYMVYAESLCECSRAGTYVSRDYWKCIRHVQQEILNICGGFSPMRETFTGEKQYTPARLLYDCGINSGTSSASWTTTSTETVGDVTYVYGNYSFTVASQYRGRGVYWTVLGADGGVKASGYNTADASTGVVPLSNLDHNNGNSPNDDGRTVYYSAGFTRYKRMAFKYFFPKTGFIPDMKPADEGGGVYDPPSVDVDDNGHYVCDYGGRGTWYKRGKSTGATGYTQYGPVDSGVAFVTGHLYRYIGDNFRDPFPGGDPQADNAVLIPYENRFYRGKLNKENQNARDASRSGTVKLGTKFSLTQADHNWWSDWANSGGTLRVEQGTASSGSNATTLKDSTKDVTDPELEHGCWWADIRYPGQAYVGFILEVDQNHDVQVPDPENEGQTITQNQTVTFRVPITSTSSSAAGIVVNFTQCDVTLPDNTVIPFVIQPGNAYRIREPAFELNKWEGRTVTITRLDGSHFETVVTHSDADTLYFAPLQEQVQPDWTYSIDEPEWGTVWKWNGSKMVKPEGADVVRPGVITPNDFKNDARMNLESYEKDYGWNMNSDAVCQELLMELYDTLNKLQWTYSDFSWTSTADKNATGDDLEQNWAMFPGQNDYGTYEIYASAADKQMAADQGHYWNDQGRPVYDVTDWQSEYDGVRNYVLRTVIESGGFFPFRESHDGVSPRRTFGINSSWFAEHDYDPSFQYRNCDEYIVHGLGLTIDSTIAVYAYPKLTDVSTLLPCTVEFNVWAEIDTYGDHMDKHHEPGHTNTQTPGSGYMGSPTIWYQDQTYTFDSGSTGVEFRSWANMGSAAVDEDGDCIGPRVGDDDNFDSLKGELVNCDAPPYTCDVINSDFPTDFAAPPNMKQQLEAMDRSDPAHGYYVWGKQEAKGYIVTQGVAIKKWQMEYNDGGGIGPMLAMRTSLSSSVPVTGQLLSTDTTMKKGCANCKRAKRGTDEG